MHTGFSNDAGGTVIFLKIPNMTLHADSCIGTDDKLEEYSVEAARNLSSIAEWTPISLSSYFVHISGSVLDDLFV